MKQKADFHNHLSTCREDLGDLALPAIRKARKTLGPEGVLGIVNAQDNGEGRYETFISGLMNHYEVDKIENGIYLPDEEIYVVKGQEVFTKDQSGHLLVLGLDEGVRLEDRVSLKDSLKQARDTGGSIILDHPYFMDGVVVRNPDRYLEFIEEGLVDGLEVHNGESWLPVPGHTHANKKAQTLFDELKKEYDIGGISSSDGHSVREIGSSYTLLDSIDFSNSGRLKETLKEAIRSHKDCSDDKRSNSIYSTLNHAGKVIGLRGLSRLGILGPVN